MMILSSLALAACLAVNAVSDHVVAGDLAPASLAFASIPADTVLAWAPAPGVQRTFHVPELRRMAARFGASSAPETDLCVTRPVAPLDPARLKAAMQAQLPEAKVEILDFSRQPVPEGALEFPLSGLRRGTAGPYWNGYVCYAGSRRFAVWARVQVRVWAPVVVAAEDLKPGRPLEAAQLRLETREDFPQPGWVAALADAVGRLPRHSIRAGAAIAARELDTAPDVARGDTVKVEVWSGATHLLLEARAEGAASIGQRVAVRNPVSSKVFFARVEAKGRASVGKENP